MTDSNNHKNLNLEGFEVLPFESLPFPFLNDRKERKYLFHRGELDSLIYRLRGTMKVLSYADALSQEYISRYLDTENYQFYLDHHNKRKPRTKIRFRDYPLTESTFLEVKRKTNTNRLIKTRIEMPYKSEIDQVSDDIWAENGLSFIKDQLRPSLTTRYQRLSLVGDNFLNKLTLDFAFSFDTKEQSKQVNDVVIAELKYDPQAGYAQRHLKLNGSRIKPMSISKYCYGISNLVPHIKTNNFKRKNRTIVQLANLKTA